jgi:hypothetical protein
MVALVLGTAQAHVHGGASTVGGGLERGEDGPGAAQLAFGSADPHAVGDVDGVRPPGPPRARLVAHVPASPAELAQRRFPVANLAPRTDPAEPPAEQVPCSVVVRSVEQLVLPQALRRMARWRRSLRRCFRAAARGDLSLARRLRPADMWLEHAECTVPELAAWDWDLEPLARGEPAVPWPVSGRSGVLPATSLARWAIAEDAAGFRDQAIVSEMLDGVCDDSMCRRGTLLCAPHVGALRDLSVALAKTEANVAKGWARPAAELPCWPLRTCPFSVVDESVRAGKPKHRLTTDLSWPHAGMMEAGGMPVDSVNGAMDRSGWPANRLVRVSEYAEAVAVLQGQVEPGGRRVRAWGLDCEAFYRAVGRQRRELWRNGVCLPDGVQMDERCCFGDASAATKCSRMSNFLVFQIRRALRQVDELYPTRDPAWLDWQAARRAVAVQRGAQSSDEIADYTSLHWCAMYIDDSMAASADDLIFDAAGAPVLMPSGEQQRRAGLHFEAARLALERYGWRSSPSKEQPPDVSIESLGVEVDMVEGRMRLGSGKCERYAAAAKAAAAARTLPSADFSELLGQLQFASSCVPLGSQHMHSLWRLSRAEFRLADSRVSVTRAVQADLEWWAAELGRPACEHVGVPLAACLMPTPEGGAGVVYADASGEGGFCAWTLVGRHVLATAGLWTVEERGMLICDLELLASTFGLVTFGSRIPLHVVSYTDNTVAQAAMGRQAARSPAMQAMLARRTGWLHERGGAEVARRITSKANIWADVGSRPELGGLAEVRRQAEAMGFSFEEMAVPAAWRGTAGLRLDEPVWGGGE